MASNKYGYMAKVGVNTDGMKDADKEISALNKELKEIDAVTKQNGQSADMLAQRNKVLAEQIRVVTEKLDRMKEAEKDIIEAGRNGLLDPDEVRKFQREIAYTEGSLEKLKNQLDDTGKSSLSLADIVKSQLIADAFEKLIGKSAELAGQLAKDSLSAYASYEQLKGGIETLFAGAEDIVLANANKAFETAQISANNYMETVTGFSATLLQGLAGDTKKAAEYADMALIDMADNANKMGTAMGSIQYAYQGFAKQNYTMLDNLKLGYGGTQAEMARLINDSGVLNGEMVATAKNVKEIPFDKIIEAIHKIQENLDIAGTSAMEAESTLEGSMNKLKASWENALVEIAAPLKDFAQEGLTVLNDNIDEIKDALVDMMDKFKPMLDDMIMKLEEWIASGGVEKLTDSFVSMVSFIVDHRDEILGVLAAIGVALSVDKIGSAIKSIKDLKGAFEGVLDTVKVTAAETEGLSAVLSGPFIAAAAVAIGSAISLATSLNEIGDAMNRITFESQKSAKNIQSMNDEWAAIAENQDKSAAGQLKKIEDAKKFRDEILEAEEDWNSRYKKTIDELNALNEKKFGTKSASEIARQKELQSQKETLDAEYEMIVLNKTKVENFLKDYDERSIENLNRSTQAQENAMKNQGKTISEAVDEVWKVAIDPDKTKAKMEEFDSALAKHQISQDEYWAQRKTYLETHRNEESEEWWKYYDEVNAHYEKLSDEEKKAADKAAKEAQTEADKARRQREDSFKQKKDDLKAESELNDYGDDWYFKQWEALIKAESDGSDFYIEESKKLALERKKAKKKLDDEELKEWKKSTEETAKEIKKSYEDTTKAYEAAVKDYGKEITKLTTKVTDDKGKDRIVFNDLKEENKKLDKYSSSMEKLKGTNISDSLMSEIMKLDYDDGTRQAYIDELLGMSEKQREKYYKDWEAYQKKVEQTANADVQDELMATDQKVVDGVKDIFESLPGYAYEKGADAALQLLAGIMDNIGGYDTLLNAMGVKQIKTGSQSGTAATGTGATAVGGSSYSGDMVININNQEVMRTAIEDFIKQINLGGGIVGA